ncbi:DEAD/DEAH box helicase [Streptococcus australis]|uniref:DEAD/DEAH box helicase n=1 Tax=Streptococcus australis TaxID=113107 RepID=UPI000F668C80|nr:DEAD/DEAH box helicase [Streptococcus australis]RSJ98234.1 ATP-dependent helicase HepA [Streptococcus australis]
MAKLIPGKIRSEGILLYENGKVSLQEMKNQYLYFRIDNDSLRYSLDDQAIFCSCEFFQKKKFCVHLAAGEAFLKNDEEGKELLLGLEQDATESQETKEKVSFGSLFLDQVLPKIESKEVRFGLSATGHVDDYSGQFLWTLRIYRRPDERTYVVRDVVAFLQAIRKQSHFPIGKSYYEPISYAAFDPESRALIRFLEGLLSGDPVHDVLFFPNGGRHLYFPMSFFEEAVQLLMDLPSFILEVGMDAYQEVFFQELQEDSGLFSFQVVEMKEFIELQVQVSSYKMVEGRFLLANGHFYQISPLQNILIEAVQSLPLSSDQKRHVQFDLSDQTKLTYSLEQFRKIGEVKAPSNFYIHDFQPHFTFDLSEQGEVLLEVAFVYEDRIVRSEQDLKDLPYSSNFDKERMVFETILAAGFTKHFQTKRSPLLPKQIYPFFQQTLPLFEQLGEVEVSEKLLDLYQVEKPKIDIQTSGRLLEIGFEFDSIDPSEVDQVMSALIEKNDYYISQTGKVLIFDEETKRISQTLLNLRAKKTKTGQLQTNRIAAFQLSQLFETADNVQFSEEFRHLAHDLIHPEQFPLGKLQVTAKLRDYQEVGVRWLSMLNHYGFGGILADDMGLGKTLQTIAFLSSVATADSKILILAPSSLIYNWKEEFEKFAPQMKVEVIYGLKANRDEIIASNPQVAITSYASFRQDVEQYEKNQYQYLILDEAQVMKNSQTKIAQYLRKFDVPHTFALSGTPIENHVEELWSIFQIVLPGLFPGKKEFKQLSPETISQYVKPFIMRRKKSEVLQELPDLIEMTYKNELADDQKTIYLAQLKQMQDRILSSSEEELNRSKMEILSGLMRLRQICDTPSLFLEDYAGESGKLDSLRELLEQIKDGNQRVLIFSQFRGMLDIIEKELDALKMTSFKITGSTPANERQDMTNAFNSGQGDAFLISLKAGGVGLNLTGADTVILVDLWWNPAVEDQAIGRAHRMGQDKNVEVYRMITRGTIEEKIQELQTSKRHLVSTILDGTETRSSLSIEEIREILGISVE